MTSNEESDSGQSQCDIFADTQDPNEQQKEIDFEYPRLILFLWGGQINPFILMELVELDPDEVEGVWLSGVLSPKSRCKPRNFKQFTDYAISIFAKVQKSKISKKIIDNYCIFICPFHL